MSKQADKLLSELLSDEPDGVPWDRAVSEVKLTCGVQNNTAEQYIRRSSSAVAEQAADGTKLVYAPEHAAETIATGDDEVVEKEVGEPTGDSFGSLPILKDEGHPEIPRSHATGYVRRRMGDNDRKGLGKKTDIAVITAAMSDPDFSPLLIGKHGVGKDQVILHACAKTHRPVIRLVANDDPDFVDLLIGSWAPDENGDFKRRKGLLQIALENGYTFVLDEFNALSGKVQTMLNKILEDSGKNQLVIPETNQVIEPHDEFIFVATQNPNDVGYSDREDLDQATGSRFIPIEVPPLDIDGEKKVVASNTHWDENSRDLTKLLQDNGGVVSSIRALHDMGKISMWVSTRDVIQIGRMTEKLNSVRAASELVLVGRADKDDKEPIRGAINDQHW